MAERNEAVLERMKSELAHDPAQPLDSLQAVAKEIDPKVGKLSLRQFNASYVLPLKRKNTGRKKSRQQKRSGNGGDKPSKIAAANGSRDAVRRVFLDFAQDLSQAESRSSIVKVSSDLDRYVDRAIIEAKK